MSRELRRFPSSQRFPIGAGWADPIVGAERKTILLVDDDDDSARVVAHAFGKRYHVRIATDGRSGLAMALEQPGPDLVISEVTVPGLDGFAMVAQLRRRMPTRRIPIIFVSERRSPQDIVAGINAGARHYLSKPIDLADLERRVNRIFGLAA
jgi:DNA-binding response OmpR family regulator